MPRQLFAQLILHDRVRGIQLTGCLKGRRMKVAVDTTYRHLQPAGRRVQVVRALAQLDGARAEEWALRHGLALYFGSSVKGEAGIDCLTAEGSRCRWGIGIGPSGPREISRR